jgi:sugar (pentulose or hexulose) kinase
MEGLAHQLYAIYRMLTSDTEMEIVVTGGILKSPTWLKIVADLFGKNLWLPTSPRSIGLGRGDPWTEVSRGDRQPG